MSVTRSASKVCKPQILRRLLHRMVSDLLIGLIEVTVDSLARRPLSGAEEAAAHLDLLNPAYKVRRSTISGLLCVMVSS